MEPTRLRQERERLGWSQGQLADRLNCSQQQISKAERGLGGLGKVRLIEAARVFGIPPQDLLLDTEGAVIHRTQVGTVPTDYIEVFGAGAVAGVSNGNVRAPTINMGMVPFRHTYLEREGMDAKNCAIFEVVGDSMADTLVDRGSMLVDGGRHEPVDGRLYVFRWEHRLMVKRYRDAEFGPWWTSDNPAYTPIPWDDSMEVWGEVKWFSRTF